MGFCFLLILSEKNTAIYFILIVLSSMFIGRTLEMRDVGFSSEQQCHFSFLCHIVFTQLGNDGSTQISIPVCMTACLPENGHSRSGPV